MDPPTIGCRCGYPSIYDTTGLVTEFDVGEPPGNRQKPDGTGATERNTACVGAR